MYVFYIQWMYLTYTGSTEYNNKSNQLKARMRSVFITRLFKQFLKIFGPMNGEVTT